jgi:hypothetical protein
MPTPCDNCPIRKGCDWLSEMCQLSARQLIKQRPDLVKETIFVPLRKRKHKPRPEYFAKRHKGKYIPVEIDRRRLPETAAAMVATKQANRRERMQAALERKRTAKMWAKRSAARAAAA